jgi:serine/threonine protein kinase
MQDLLKGMHVMVENQFVHRDLKPENVFIKDNKYLFLFRYKIADFGFCQPYKEKEVLSLCCGTPGYMSP